MAAFEITDTEIHFEKFEICREQCLGNGAYGEVFKARCDRLPCAAKVLYRSVFDDSDPRTVRTVQRFKDECKILKAMKHPCIIQYLGLVCDPDTGLLALLMELATESLTTMLRFHRQILPQEFQIDLSYDIALAIAYLHHNKIIHRDLSSNNILMIGAKAKVSDFGMAAILDSNENRHLTALPGTMVYMPPEASSISNLSPPTYTFKLDCFSLGVLMIQICTRRPPHPSPPTREVRVQGMTSRSLLERVPEVERRRSHIDLIESTNRLRSLAIECLHDDEADRPSADEICQQLEDMRAETTRRKRPQRIIPKKKINSVNSDSSRSTGSSTIEEKSDSSNDCGFEMVHDDKEFEIIPEPFHITHEVISSDWKLKWKRVAEDDRRLMRGDCTTNGKQLFVLYGTVISCFEMDALSWRTIATDALLYSNLAVVQGLLTTVGGRMSSNRETTNQLRSLDEDYKKWSTLFPPMPTERCFASTASSNRALVVAGGTTTGQAEQNTDVVEVLDLASLSWVVASHLPKPLAKGSMTLNEDSLFILGKKEIYTCSLTSLLNSCAPTTLGQKMLRRFRGGSPKQIWKNFSPCVCSRATLASVNGDLVAFGGMNTKNEVASCIHRYNKKRECWEMVDHIGLARYYSLVGVVQNSVLVVVGGCTSNHQPTNVTEVATFPALQD